MDAAQHFWYRERDGQILGPVDRATLEDLARRLVIDVETEICRDEHNNWIKAGTLPDLFSHGLALTAQPSGSRAEDLQSGRAAELQAASSINPYQAPTTTDLSTPENLPIGNDFDPASLALTRKGLRCLYYGICAVLIGFMGIAVLAAMGAALDKQALMALSPIMGLLGCLGGLVSILIGLILCLTIPDATGARRSIQVSFVCLPLIIAVNVGGVLLSTLLFRLGNGSFIGLMGPFPRLLSLILAFVSLLAFLRFLRHLANYLGKPRFAVSATSIMRMASVMFCLYLFSQTVSFIIAIAYPTMTVALFSIGIVLLLGFLLTVLTFIRTANLVSYLAKAIPNPR